MQCFEDGLIEWAHMGVSGPAGEFPLLPEHPVCSSNRVSKPDTLGLPGSGWAPGRAVLREQDVGPGMCHVYEVSITSLEEGAGEFIWR